MKKTNVLLAFAAFFIFSVSLWVVPEANAVPGFARQTGLACSTCHFQHFPSLNAFGRAFKAGGYTQIGGQGKIEGEDLSIPDTLNASLVTKVRYQKTNGKNTTAAPANAESGTNKGELQFPDEAALLIGGRAGEHIGFLLEAGLTPETPAAGEITSLFTSYKMPIVYDVGPVKLSVIPFTTDALGASYGFELLNTGAVRHQRAFEHRTETSAQQYIGTATAAEGFAFVAYNEMGYINYTLWGPAHGTTPVGPLSNYFRVAATPNLGGWDMGFGAQLWSGTTDVGNNTKYPTHAYAVDAQMQGDVGLPLGVYLSYGNAKKTKTDDTANFFNSNAKDKKALAVLAELGVLPGKATIAAGYRSGDTGEAANNKQNAITLGASYLLAQNVQLQLNYSMYSGSYYDLAANNEDSTGDRLATLMLFAAF